MKKCNCLLIVVVSVVSIIMKLQSADAESMNGMLADQSATKIILDVDVGTDDAWAIKLLADNEKEQGYEILGIVASYGNTNRNYTLRNVYMILEIIGRLDIPVYLGAFESIIKHNPLEVSFHGVDGFGDAGDYGIDPQIHLAQNESAVEFMHRVVTAYPNEVTIFGVGPLTTLGLFLKTHSEVNDKIKEIYIMGGNDPSIGNLENVAEFNFKQDPEAVDIVFRRANCPITMYTWEASTQPHFSIPLSWYLELPQNPVSARFVQFMRRIEEHTYTAAGSDEWAPCDALLIAIFLHPDSIVSEKNSTVILELSKHENRRGQVIESPSSGTNIRVIEEMSVDRFKEIILHNIRD